LTEVPLGGTAMAKYEGLAPEERARITDMLDLLIERFVEHKEAIEEGQQVRAKELEAEIKKLQREKENVTS
jgi:molybdenum-dependent DNA-binding transcriptional regulator ModE